MLRESQEPDGSVDVIRIEDPNLRFGFAQVPRPVLKAKDLSDKAKIVYALLLDYAWQQGSCFPGQHRLAEDLGTTERTIQRALNELKDYRLVTWKRRGLSQTNIYYILSLSSNPRFDLSGPSLEPDTTKMSHQDRTKMSAQDTTRMSHKEYPVGIDTEENNVVVVSALRGFGISAAVAKRLASTYPEPYILNKLDLVQWLVETRSPLVGKNPAGYLRRAIEEDYSAPPRYKSPTQRRTEAEARDQAEHDEQERRREAEADYARVKVLDQQQLTERYPPQPIPGTTLTTQEAWEQALDQLHTQVTRPNFEMWLRPTTLVSCDGQRAVIAAPSRYHAETLAGRLAPLVQHALSTVLSTPVQCQYVPVPDLLEAGEPSTNGCTPTDARSPTGHTPTAATSRPRPGGVRA